MEDKNKAIIKYSLTEITGYSIIQIIEKSSFIIDKTALYSFDGKGRLHIIYKI